MYFCVCLYIKEKSVDKIIHIRVPEDVYKVLEEEALKNDRKISAMARFVLIQWATKEQEKKV